MSAIEEKDTEKKIKDEFSNNTFLFKLSEEKEIVQCFEEHGVVVVRGVLTKLECRETFADMGLPVDCDITNPVTYPLMDKILNRYGVAGDRPLFSKALLRNRTHPNVQRLFNLLYGDSCGPLIVQHDRIGIMRPTTGKYGAESWRVPDVHPNLHLDIDPFGYFASEFRTKVDEFLANLQYDDLRDFIAENNAKHITMGRQIQAVINLVDNRYEDGGFHCVPLSNPVKVLANWVKEVKDSKEFKESKFTPVANGRYIFSSDKSSDARVLEKGMFGALRLPCPAGSLILFDATLPHGTLPNFSDRIRVIQFLRYMPASIIVNRKKRANRVAKECERVNFVINDDNRKLLLGDK